MKQRIEFLTLEVENFKSVGPKVKFNFSKHSGLNYVIGINRDVEGCGNGAGKSVLFCDAILFGIFGRTSNHNKNSYIPNRAMTGSKVDTRVQIELKISSDIYKIISIIKHNNPNVVYSQLWKNNNDITKPSGPETRKFIQQEILRCSANMFKNSIAISASEINNFFGMRKSQKREYIEESFGLSVFGRMLKAVRADFNALDREITSLEREESTLSSTLDQLIIQAKQFSEEREKKVHLLEMKLREKKVNLIELKTELTQTDIKDTEALIVKDKIKKMISDLESAKMKADNSKKHADTSHLHIKRRISSITKITQKVCSECAKKLGDDCNLAEDEEKLKEEQQIAKDAQIMIDAIDEKLKALYGHLKSVEEAASRAASTAKIIERNQWQQQSYITEIKSIESKIIEEKASQPPFDEMINTTKTKHESVNTRLKDYYKKKAMYDIIITTVGEEGAKKYLIKDLADVLNGLVQKYVQEMGGEYTCVFDESFDVKFLTTTGECEYSSFSMGERQRINLAVMMAFQDLQSTNLEPSISVFDEVLDHGVDTYGFKAAINILKRRALDRKQTVFVISHREAATDEGLFHNVIEVEKKASMTRIISDYQDEIIGA